MSTATVERHVRLCPTHKVEVEQRGTQLVCPRGWHAVSHFRVLDRLKRVITDVPVDGDQTRGGITDMNSTTATRGPAVAATATAPVRPAGKATELLAKAKFGDPDGSVLWIRLVRHRTKRDGDVWLVRWARHDAGKKAKAQTAALVAEMYQEKARDAFATAVSDARKSGWQDLPVFHREMRFLPLPKPAAARKGR